MKRKTLRQARRENLDRLAKYLRLRTAPTWSLRHLVNLIYWRITRSDRSRH